jgi:hypothetical protein
MAAEIEPPELAALLDFAERPRVEDWSLRAGLVRYAQREPQRVSDVLDVVRRLEFGFKPHLKAVAKQGAAYWGALSGNGAGDGVEPADGLAVELLRVMADVDRLGESVATWAADPRAVEQPDAAVDSMTAAASRRLDELGVAREERRPPPGARSRG